MKPGDAWIHPPHWLSGREGGRVSRLFLGIDRGGDGATHVGASMMHDGAPTWHDGDPIRLDGAPMRLDGGPIRLADASMR
jgi:hypothetical protein